jgi:hypothetical protein
MEVSAALTAGEQSRSANSDCKTKLFHAGYSFNTSEGQPRQNVRRAAHLDYVRDR